MPPEIRAASSSLVSQRRVGPTEITAHARRRFDRVCQTLDAAFRHPAAHESLSFAATVVRIDVTDLPGGVVTLMLDRDPPEAVAGSLPARPDIRLYMRAEDLEAMFREGEYLPMQILSGAVEFEGPVRKFLRVLPILRFAAAEAEPGPTRR